MYKDFGIAINLNGNKATGVSSGTDPTDAVNKQQLDAQAGGRLIDSFELPAVEDQLTITIPTIYRNKNYRVFNNGNRLKTTAYTHNGTTISIASGTWIGAGTFEVDVYS